MKKILFYAFLIAVFIAAAVLAGIKYNSVEAESGSCCGGHGSHGSHGQAPEANASFWGSGVPQGAVSVEKISDVLTKESHYAGKNVIVRGRVEDECGMGGWLDINDGSGKIRADLHPSGFTVPQIKGSKVKVYGKVKMDGKVVEIIGQRVELEK